METIIDYPCGGVNQCCARCRCLVGPGDHKCIVDLFDKIDSLTESIVTLREDILNLKRQIEMRKVGLIK